MNERGTSSVWLRLIIFLLVAGSVVAGFLPVFGLEARLYYSAFGVFLFNLASGGFLIITRLNGSRARSSLAAAYLMFSLCFCVAALLDLPALGIISAVLLALVVESVRGLCFSWFPREFFQGEKTSRKFEQASLLCLSLGLLICAGTLLNNEYLGLVRLAKLDLHVFYLGFSFPVSLITFSSIFARLERGQHPPGVGISSYCFWALNLGVILFFIFILFEIYSLQLVMALTLFSVVLATAHLHLSRGIRDDTWAMLSSALTFLTLGSLLGILYVVVQWLYSLASSGQILSLHSAATVYGWNMTWIILAARGEHEIRRINPWRLIPLHWTFVILLPVARLSRPFALLDAGILLVLLSTAFFFKGKTISAARPSEICSSDPWE